jgi:hypothetical protein
MSNDDLYDEFEKRMTETYPLMFSRPFGGFAIGPGWWPIIESLCANIQSHIDWRNRQREELLKDNPYNHPIPEHVEQVVVAQIKEKFGGLRFYYQGGDDIIAGMVRMAEAWADRSCEDCGNPGKQRGGGWVRTLCDDHEAEYQARKLAFQQQFESEK